ncbi:guanine deaminase [Robbsia andropogonis]|uniref:Guanine deaminase n=1 Tax=Robbsia andropogonis TaxID=28092 RepID=A0A0F5JY54_9BURK|nr:guanine deaminase [Robbsia andropogonis]KKB62816.1 guanine deaminase [Robbsia andropogonis]MCP1118060.1 guanine deaminase [Robbsia andropogonis]MCP1127659.1 guanine deaminase [Robbsia andropogonis]
MTENETLSAPHDGAPLAAIYRASLLYFTNDPAIDAGALQWHEDGALHVCGGRIVDVGDTADVLARAAIPVEGRADKPVMHDWRGRIIMPGFIDTHLHFPQIEMIGSPAPGLLPWLEHYTFPTERAFEDQSHAKAIADVFVDELLRNGTTTAMVYCSVHPTSVDALFQTCAKRDLRMIAGKVMMDRHCPPWIADTAERGARETEALIQRWHGKQRLAYAITPRFAPTSTPEQLGLAGALAQQYSDTYVQSHVAENQDEVAWVRALFPASRSYLDVYDHAGLLRERAMYGHCIYLDDEDRRRMASTGAAAAVCPTSNLFLGSGLFDFEKARASKMVTTLATDVGGGTSFSMLATMNEAYKVARMGGYYLDATTMFYMVTLGAARALRLEGTVGSLGVGNDADFIVVDRHATPLLSRRTDRCTSTDEVLFAIAMLGDDRAIAATFSYGRCVHRRA